MYRKAIEGLIGQCPRTCARAELMDGFSDRDINLTDGRLWVCDSEVTVFWLWGLLIPEVSG